MFKYLLFDFDGTLVDTNELIIFCLNETSKQFLGKDLSPDELNSILGKYLDEQMRCLCESKCQEMVLYYKNLYKANQDNMIKSFPGIKNMLSRLKALDCKIAIVSAKGRGGIEHGLRHFEMEQFIDVIISAYDIQNNKPHAEPALKALEAFGANPCEALLIGDSPYDILCGKNAGIKTALVDWSIFPRNEILKLYPNFQIKTPDELVEIIRLSL